MCEMQQIGEWTTKQKLARYEHEQLRNKHVKICTNSLCTTSEMIIIKYAERLDNHISVSASPLDRLSRLTHADLPVTTQILGFTGASAIHVTTLSWAGDSRSDLRLQVKQRLGAGRSGSGGPLPAGDDSRTSHGEPDTATPYTVTTSAPQPDRPPPLDARAVMSVSGHRVLLSELS